jgi:integrase
MLTGAVGTARRRAKVSDFRFHDYRHVAQTNWVRQNIHVDIAMKGAGHKSVAMHQRYVNLKEGDVGRAFRLLEMVDTDGRHEEKRENKERATS